MKDERQEIMNPAELQQDSQRQRQIDSYELLGEVNYLHTPNPSWLDKATAMRPH